MRKVIGFFCMSLLVVLAARAEAKESYAGIKGGLNMASLTGDNTDDLDSRNGFMGGAFYGMNFGEGDFGARIEGLYVNKGAEGPFVVPGDDHAHDSIIKLDYIEFPVLFVVNLGSGKKLGFNLFAGPTIGFNIKAEVEIPGHDETVDLAEEAESVEFGGALGGGLEYMLSSFALVLDVRYSIGATNIVESDGGDIKNSGVGVMAGVSFPLGAK